MFIRRAGPGDLPVIENIYAAAREFMIKTGNPSQWGSSSPAVELTKGDIEAGRCLLICGEDGPHGVFAVCEGEEPAYRRIDGGKWLNDLPYVTIHRLAGDGLAHGIFSGALAYCEKRYPNIRVDTHRDNAVMLSLLRRSGFSECGTVYVRDGTPRTAFQRYRPETVIDLSL